MKLFNSFCRYNFSIYFCRVKMDGKGADFWQHIFFEALYLSC